MEKTIKMMLIASAAAAFVACSNDDEPEAPNPDQPTATEGAFVLNQGNYGKQIEGSLTLIDYNSSTAQQSLFQKANGRSIGATPQGAVVYGDKIYLGIYGSNVVEIIDRNTYKSLKQISLSNAEGQSPRSLVAKDGKVYISMYNGFVSRLDTLTMSIDKTVKVGPNPEIIAIKGNYLYVPNSDGMNWAVGYGTTATKINLTSFTAESTFDVPLNPCEFASNGTDLYLLSKGNYGDVASKVYRIDDNNNATEVAEATLIALKDKKLYYINAPYGVAEITYAVYDGSNGNTSKMLSDNGVESPAGLGVDPLNGNIVITSYSMDNGWASYATDGYAKVYDSTGNFLNRYDVGVGPCAVFFNYK